MAGLQLSGLASGFDWKSVVDQLIAIERTPQTKMRTEKTTNTNKISALATLRTKLTAFQDSAKALSSTSLFGQRTVSFSDTDLKWSATASSGAAAGQYTFNVSQLATRTVREGGAGAAARLSDDATVDDLVLASLRTSVPIRAGSFTVNGAKIDVATTDTLGDVLSRISTATGGAVTAAYDPDHDVVRLTSGSPITLGGGGDTSNFLFALKLHNNGTGTVSSASALGAVRLFDTIDNAGLGTAVGSGERTLTINGVAINYNAGTDSIRDVMDRVNASDAGVTMSYDSANGRFTLQNKGTGNLGLVVSEDPGGLLAALRLADGAAAVTMGDNAIFTLNNGGQIVTSSNTLDSSVHGISGLTVTATSTGSQTVTVGSDTAAIEKGINDFIAKYNDVQNYIDQQTRVTVGSDGKVSAGLMANNREFADIARQLRSSVFGAVSGTAADMSRLEAIGIDFNAASTQLSVRDSAKLSNALANNLGGVAALFTTPSTGIAARLDAYVTRLTSTSGLLDSQTKSLERQNSSLDTQIADLERRITAERNRLEASFIAMEEAQSKIQTQLSSLSNMLANNR